MSISYEMEHAQANEEEPGNIDVFAEAAEQIDRQGYADVAETDQRVVMVERDEAVEHVVAAAERNNQALPAWVSEFAGYGALRAYVAISNDETLQPGQGAVLAVSPYAPKESAVMAAVISPESGDTRTLNRTARAHLGKLMHFGPWPR